MITSIVRALALLLLVSSTIARAQVPQIINYQGRVAVGTVNFDGSGAFKFALVNAAGAVTYWSNDGTSTLGLEPTAAVTLSVTKGLYSVLLGDTTLANMTAIPNSVFNNADVRLRVWFNNGTNGSQLFTPDQRLAAVGYAMVAGGVNLPATTSATEGVITQGATPLMHSFGFHNFFAGINAGNFSMTGDFNLGLGSGALASNTQGNTNVAGGLNALAANTTGGGNTAMGSQALRYNLTGINNTATGGNALFFNSTGNDNTAHGAFALESATGSNNIALGRLAGYNLTSGNNNIAIGHQGVAGESKIIRIGTPGTQTDTYLTGIIHGDGAGLTGVNAATITSGAVGSAQLAASVAAGLWTASDANVYRGGGNVGIGTDTPATALEVAGTITVSNYFGGIRNVGDGGSFSLSDGGNVERGTLALPEGVGQFSDDAAGNDIVLRAVTGKLLLQSGAGASAIAIATNNNVGFGTATPATTLTVQASGYGIEHTDGTRRLSTYLDSSGASLGTMGADPLRFFINQNHMMILDINGNFGIGTLVPTRRLHVSTGANVVGRFDSSSTIGTWLALGNSSAGGSYWHLISTGSGNGEGAGKLLIGSGASDGNSGVKMTLDTNGNVGIGTTSPATKLHVAGEITVTAVNITSDRSAKERFKPVDTRAVLDKVVRLPITEWQYKEQADARHIGPMAQDFREAFALGRDENHITTVDADGVALAAIQGLNEKLDEQARNKDHRIRELEKSVAELKALVNQLASERNGGAR